MPSLGKSKCRTGAGASESRSSTDALKIFHDSAARRRTAIQRADGAGGLDKLDLREKLDLRTVSTSSTSGGSSTSGTGGLDKLDLREKVDLRDGGLDKLDLRE
ncbi:MAG TPA: hypothetical protein VFC59_02125 [Cryobacterium sp.]|nr:hypothetical protein [Cryobacterium sp.]